PKQASLPAQQPVLAIPASIVDCCDLLADAKADAPSKTPPVRQLRSRESQMPRVATAKPSGIARSPAAGNEPPRRRAIRHFRRVVVPFRCRTLPRVLLRAALPGCCV